MLFCVPGKWVARLGARPLSLPSPGDVPVAVDIRAEGGWKPVLIAFQWSFSLAMCLQGFVRNQGTGCPMCLGLQGSLGMWDFQCCIWATWMIVTQGSLPCLRGFKWLEFLFLHPLRYQVSTGLTSALWSHGGRALRPGSAATLDPKGFSPRCSNDGFGQLLWDTVSAALRWRPHCCGA